ncbi:amidohydrolase [Microbacterium paludicola]|uniref:amidohydrolase family protein n=1 Tax=Microbacterium paludicola TaxID=300019 RepID=UPI0011A273A9|nr:amidohydrolase family protein [Microbacterium paludicola]
MRILDSHLHLWDPARLTYDWLEGPLQARFAEAEVAQARRADDEHSAIFVQAGAAPEQFLLEAQWVASIAEATGVRGIVAGVPLDAGEATERDLDAVRQIPLVVGVRHLLQDEPAGLARTDAFLDGARALAARDLTFDACVRTVDQLHDVAALAAAVPDLRIVLDHLGKPAVGTAGAPEAPAAEWVAALRALAAHGRVFCKLSGLPAEAGGDWSPAQVAPFLDEALTAFGSERLMFGSDWPVSAVAASGSSEGGGAGVDADAIGGWTDAVATWAAARGIDVDAVMRANAERFYGLA